MKLDHPNILEVLEMYTWDGKYFVITEFLEKGNLEMEIKKKKIFMEKQVANIIYQVLLAANYCHGNGVIHRDLKPMSILVENVDSNEKYDVKVVDFGTLNSLEENLKVKRKLGSINYMAPEVLSSTKYDAKCDLWSIGVITYLFLLGILPFDNEDENIIMSNIRKGEVKFDKVKAVKISTPAKELICKMLEVDPNKRITAFDALNHPWFEKYHLKEKNSYVENNKLKSFVENLRTFDDGQRLQHVCIALIVHNLPENDDIKELERAFASMDKNLDGKLTKEELINGFKGIYKTRKESDIKEEVEKLFSRLDSDKSGHLSYEEFIRGAIDKNKLINDTNLRFAFSCIDDNNSGFISSMELHNVLCSGKDHDVASKTIFAMMKDIDINSDGKMSFDEFRQMMHKIILD
jgi:calcium-dependent protein kinase